MDIENIKSIIAAVGTVIISIVSSYPAIKEKYKKYKNNEKISMLREVVIILIAFLFGVVLVSATWIYAALKPSEVVTIKGLYKDRMPTKKTYYANDQIEIKISKDGAAEGYVKGKVEQPDQTFKEKKWRVQGYRWSDYLVLSYLTSEVNPEGIGIYILKRNNDYYTGYTIIKDCTGVYYSPYAGTRNEDALRQADYWTKMQKDDWIQKIFPRLYKNPATDLLFYTD